MKGVVRAIAVLALAASSAAQAGKFNVVEFVDLSCSHCASFAPVAESIARQVRADGGIFRVAPVGPLAEGSTQPSLPMLAVYWFELHRGDAAAQQVADAFYSGYANGAAINTISGITSWLSVSGIELNEQPKLDDYALRLRFGRAVRLALDNGVRDLPAVLLLDSQDGHAMSTITWSGSSASMQDAVQKAMKEK